MADYIEKIRNLLALAESPNVHEARSALLKARELMAKHKISEAQVTGKTENQKVLRQVSGITYSMRRDPWISDLATIIAEHHCCKNFQQREKGHQIAEIGFIGLSDDIPVCMEIFRYAVDCVQSETKKLKAKHGVKIANGYGFGFVVGLREAYHKQQVESNWGLVLVVPKAVTDIVNGIIKRKVNTSKQTVVDARAFSNGIIDGRKFHEQKRIAGKEKI